MAKGRPKGTPKTGGRQAGTLNRDKPFREALRMEALLAEQGQKSPAHRGSLRSIARKLLERAEDETNAAREIADRLDGKAVAIIAGSDEEPAIKVQINPADLSEDDLAAALRIAEQVHGDDE